MLVTYIISLFIILGQILVIKNTLVKKKHDSDWEPLSMPRWIIVIYTVVFIIPILNLIILVVTLPWISWYCDDKYYDFKIVASDKIAKFIQKVWKSINDSLSKPL